MENYKKNLVELISNLSLEYKENPAVIPYAPQKTAISVEEAPSMPRATPESRGIPSARLTRLYERLEAEERANVHSIVVAKGGAVISEVSRPGFSPRLPHLSHSMSKSVTGMLVMLLWDDGKIDTGERVASFFPELTPRDKRFSEMTVEHLLTMSSGSPFGEVGVVSDDEWTRTFFDCELTFAPGERFAYNSMNSYILAHIADKICRREYGISAEAFLFDRLFAPLDIPRPTWEKSPEGIIKGGFGLYLSTESWAKLGCMMLDGGRYGGRIILSREAVALISSVHSVTDPSAGDFNYGYHVWVSRTGDDFLFNGMLGQNVWISPATGTVVALTSGNNELFSKGAALGIIREELSASGGDVRRTARSARELDARERAFFASRRWITPKSPLRGLSYILGLRPKTPFPAAFLPLIGEYTLPSNNQGLLPAFVRVMQNNYGGGIRALRFERAGELLRLTCREGVGDITFDFGIYAPVNNAVDFAGERYIISALAEAVEEADGSVRYKLELLFPELPNTRRITLTLSPLGRLTVSMHEIPDERIADSFVESIPTLSGRLGFLYSMLERNLGKNFITEKLTEIFSPTLTAYSVTAPDLEAALAAEEEKKATKVAASRLVRSLIFNFLGNEEKSAEDGGGALGRLAGFIGKFF